MPPDGANSTQACPGSSELSATAVWPVSPTTAPSWPQTQAPGRVGLPLDLPPGPTQKHHHLFETHLVPFCLRNSHWLLTVHPQPSPLPHVNWWLRTALPPTPSLCTAGGHPRHISQRRLSWLILGEEGDRVACPSLSPYFLCKRSPQPGARNHIKGRHLSPATCWPQDRLTPCGCRQHFLTEGRWC